MGIASGLFYSTDTDKSTLYRRIIPTDEQFNTQQERWKDLMEFLKSDLSEVTGLAISSWLQGSYKFATQIRPVSPSEEFDVDLGVYFSWSSRGGEIHSPKDLKSIVQKSLEDYKKEEGGDEDDVHVVSPPKNRCSRIKFPDNFHIDVPAFHLNTDNEICALATEETAGRTATQKIFMIGFSLN